MPDVIIYLFVPHHLHKISLIPLTSVQTWGTATSTKNSWEEIKKKNMKIFAFWLKCIHQNYIVHLWMYIWAHHYCFNTDLKKMLCLFFFSHSHSLRAFHHGHLYYVQVIISIPQQQQRQSFHYYILADDYTCVTLHIYFVPLRIFYCDNTVNCYLWVLSHMLVTALTDLLRAPVSTIVQLSLLKLPPQK